MEKRCGRTKGTLESERRRTADSSLSVLCCVAKLLLFFLTCSFRKVRQSSSVSQWSAAGWRQGVNTCGHVTDGVRVTWGCAKRDTINLLRVNQCSSETDDGGNRLTLVENKSFHWFIVQFTNPGWPTFISQIQSMKSADEGKA